MTAEQDEVLNITQQVLRGLIANLAMRDLEAATKLASGLQAFAAAPDLHPVAQGMLLDLATGAAMLGKLNAPKQ